MDRKQESGTSEANVVYGRTGKLLGAAFLIGVVINLFDNRPVSRFISAWIPLPNVAFLSDPALSAGGSAWSFNRRTDRLALQHQPESLSARDRRALDFDPTTGHDRALSWSPLGPIFRRAGSSLTKHLSIC